MIDFQLDNADFETNVEGELITEIGNEFQILGQWYNVSNVWDDR